MTDIQLFIEARMAEDAKLLAGFVVNDETEWALTDAGGHVLTPKSRLWWDLKSVRHVLQNVNFWPDAMHRAVALRWAAHPDYRMEWAP